MRKEAVTNTFVHLDSQPQSAVDPVALLLHTGQPEAEAESGGSAVAGTCTNGGTCNYRTRAVTNLKSWADHEWIHPNQRRNMKDLSLHEFNFSN